MKSANDSNHHSEQVDINKEIQHNIESENLEQVTPATQLTIDNMEGDEKKSQTYSPNRRKLGKLFLF